MHQFEFDSDSGFSMRAICPGTFPLSFTYRGDRSLFQVETDPLQQKNIWQKEPTMFTQRVLWCCAAMLLPAAAFGASSSDIADAAMKENKQAVRSLLQKKADVNAPQVDGTTALHWAVRWDDIETADALIRAGANVSAATRAGATPLQLAATNGSAAMIEKLIKAGADPNAPLTK